MPDKGSLAQDMADYNAGRAGVPVGGIAGGLGFRDYQDSQKRSGGNDRINRGNDSAWLDRLPAHYAPPKTSYTGKSRTTFGDTLLAILLICLFGVPGFGAAVYFIWRLPTTWQSGDWIFAGLAAAASAGIGFWLFGTDSGYAVRMAIVKAVAYTALAAMLAFAAYCLYLFIPLFYQEFWIK